MIYTNRESDYFKDVVKKGLCESHNITIAVGYTSIYAIELMSNLIKASSEKNVKILLGMMHFESLDQKLKNSLVSLNDKLRESEGSGVFLSTEQNFHGKVYMFGDDYYIGSSNFSHAGMKLNLELMMQVQSEEDKIELAKYLDYLFSSEHSKRIDDSLFNDIYNGDVSEIPEVNEFSITSDSLKIEMYREGQKKSALNACYGKPRNPTNPHPRDWFETSLIASQEIYRLDSYPKGNFCAYTGSEYIKMRTGGDNYKNIESSGDLKIFGRWIKGELMKKGSLRKGEMVTFDTIRHFGTNLLVLKRDANKTDKGLPVYLMFFDFSKKF